MIETTVAMAAMAGLFVVFGAFRIAERGGPCDSCGSAGEGCGACPANDACALSDAACAVSGTPARAGADHEVTPDGGMEYHTRGNPS